MLRQFRRFFALSLVAMLLAALAPASAFADDTPAAIGSPASSDTPPSPSSDTGTTSAAGASVKPGEIAAGNAKAISQISGMFTSLIDTAVTVSAKVKPEADKFAGGLAVITVVLAAVTFAATRDPIMAWVRLFEELAVLGIFAALYVGYASFAPGFYKWFLGLANSISGADMSSASSIMGNAAGQIFDAFTKAFGTAHWWEVPAVLMAVGPLVVAWAVLSLASLVFLFFINIGQIQMAVGTVMGQIALSLGFSSFTRGYFKAWLDYMISAGMYVVVAAILVALVTNSLTSAISAATNQGLSTPGAAAYVMDLALFVFLLSFEIPKMAGMFGGGANASGAAIGKVAKAATAGLV